MESQEELATLVESYLDASLPPEELQLFEARCKDDPEFAEQVKLHIKAIYAVKSFTKDQRKAHFNQLYDQSPPTNSNSLFNNRNTLLAIAAAIILATFAILFWPKSPVASLPELYALALEKEVEENPLQMPAERIRANNTASPTQLQLKKHWTNASNAFNEKKYEESIMHIQRLMEDTSFRNVPTAQFYLGLNHLLLSEEIAQTDTETSNTISQSYLNQAIRHFKEVSPSSTAIERAMWFQALCHLNANQPPMARLALDKIIAYPNHYRKEEAKQLLQQFPLKE